MKHQMTLDTNAEWMPDSLFAQDAQEATLRTFSAVADAHEYIIANLDCSQPYAYTPHYTSQGFVIQENWNHTYLCTDGNWRPNTF